MAINTFRPGGLTYRNSYGWAGSQGYNSQDIPGWFRSGPRTREILEQQFAYEWYDYSSGLRGSSNPPFHSGAAGSLLPSLTQGGLPNGQPARILRGFIRRAEFDPTNTISLARLYFMYNPEVIVRDYVSYLDQGALDPFNTVFDSGNLVAPPSFMDFSFELFFDRQAEAQRFDNPGVFVDYEYFDLVVRNVVPRRQGRNNQLPDNGVMMVNPRDITVVFSPSITVQGRPLNARVSFEKFTHRMVPTRMRISLTMRVIYIGPVRDMTVYENEEFAVSQMIPWDEEKDYRGYRFRYQDLEVEESEISQFFGGGGTTPVTGPGSATDIRDRNYTENSMIRKQALDYAQAQVSANGTTYSLPGRANLWRQADCSSLVCGAYNAIGWGDELKMGSLPSTGGMILNWNTEGWRTAGAMWTTVGQGSSHVDDLEPGDLIYRVSVAGESNHVAFFHSKTDTHLRMFHAMSPNANPSVGFSEWAINGDYFAGYNYGVKPCPAGRDAVTNSGGQSTRQDSARYSGIPQPV
jgi:hypothetical protein